MVSLAVGGHGYMGLAVACISPVHRGLRLVQQLQRAVPRGGGRSRRGGFYEDRTAGEARPESRDGMGERGGAQ